MQVQDAHGVSMFVAVGFCAAAWVSGAIFGWGLREARELIGDVRRTTKPSRRQPLLPTPPAPPAPPARAPGLKPEPASAEPPRRRRSKNRRQRRGGGYYFSEEARGWGDGRWRRRAGWATVGVIVVLLGGSTILAATNYKPAHRGAPTLRR